LAALPPVQAALATLLLFMATSSADAVCLEAGPQGGLISVSLRHFPMEREFQASTFVLTAKVLSARDDFSDHPGAKRYYPATFYRVARLKSFKGNPPEVLTIYTERSSGGFYMDTGKSYLLFVHHEGSDWAVDNCGYSDLVSQSKDAIGQLERMPQIRR